MHQKPQSATAVDINQIEEFGAFFIHLPGAVGFEAEKLADAEGGFALCEVLWRNSIACKILIRNVDAAECRVFMYIANDVGELERQAKLFCKISARGSLKPNTCVQVRPTVPATR